jgi:NADH dehydrogenase
VGGHVARALHARGVGFRAFARSARGGDWFAATGVPVVRGDIADPDACRRAVAGCSTVLHLAAAADVSDAAVNRRVNVGGLENLLAAARTAGVRHFVFVSSTCAGRARRDAYGETKRLGEGLVQQGGVPFTIVRPTMIYGAGSKEWDTFVGVIRHSPLVPIFGTGRRVVQPVWVGDAVAALVALAGGEPRGRVFDLAGPAPVSFDALVHAVARALGVRRRIVHVPVAPVLLLARALGRLATHVPLTVDQVLAFTQDTQVDPGPLMREIAHTPVPIEVGLEREIRPAR